MANISITWQNGAPYAPDIVVTGKNAEVITWVPDNTVNVTAISRPTNASNGNEFTDPAPVGNSRNWQCRDACSADGEFPYTITGSQAPSKKPVSHDPKITNTRGGI